MRLHNKRSWFANAVGAASGGSRLAAMGPSRRSPAAGWLRRPVACVLASACVLSLLARPCSGQLTDEQVRNAISQGVDYLKGRQNRLTGRWAPHANQPGGKSALITLALLNCGVPKDDPVIVASMAYLRTLTEPSATYSSALILMVLSIYEPELDRPLIQKHVEFLERAQLKQGRMAGAWSYGGRGGGDNSNAQFALLGLHEAERAGYRVDPGVWTAALDYWKRAQNDDGSFGYMVRSAATGSMTCAGVSSLVIASGRLNTGDAKVNGENVECCQPQEDNREIEAGLEWLGRHFSVNWNPIARGRGNTGNRSNLFYYLYGVERVGRLTGRRFLADHDWYREGAEMFVHRQADVGGSWRAIGHGESDPLVATSFALLFLSKGRRPVVVSKIKHPREDWDSHRAGIPNLTRRCEQAWRQDLTWQTIDLNSATVDDLIQSPVLFISGSRSLQLAVEMKADLKEYVNRGGFIFAEASCDGTDFDRSFRALMSELFPDNKLMLLPADHPVWYAQRKIDARYARPLYGINACCRTSVVYCPQTLSCYWELANFDREVSYPRAVRDEIEAVAGIGENVLAYATNRQLKAKLDLPQFALADEADRRVARGTLFVPKLIHSGGHDDAPSALTNLLRELRGQINVRTNWEHLLLAPDSDRLPDYAATFMHGRRGFKFSPAERLALTQYLSRGGFLLADSICASQEFTDSFRQEINSLFPTARLTQLPSTHPLLSTEYRGYDISTVTLRDPQIRGGDDPLEAKLVSTSPLLEALEIDGRIAVVFSPYDLSCALENHASLECKGYTRDAAARIGINVLLFAIQQ